MEKRLALALPLSLVLGCGEDPNATPTLAELQRTIFSPTCATISCHGKTPTGVPTMNPLDMREGASHASLVGRDSFWSTKKRVVAGDPDASFIIEKITSDMPMPTGMVKDGYTNDRMPVDCKLDSLCLTAAQVEKIRKWIKAGARND